MKFLITLSMALLVRNEAFAANKDLVQTASNQRNCSQKVSTAFLKEMQREELKPVSVRAQDGNGSAREIGASDRSYDVVYLDQKSGTRYAAQMKIAFQPTKTGFKCKPVTVDIYGVDMTAYHWPERVW